MRRHQFAQKTSQKKSQLPVIMVTAKGAEEEKILGFEQGADDYVSKPLLITEH